MRRHAVYYSCRFLVFLQYFHTDIDMRTLALVIQRLAYIVEQTRSLGQCDIQTELSGHESCQMCDLDRMFQHVLTVGRPVFEPSQKFHQFRMQVVYAYFESCLLSFFLYYGVHLALRLMDHFLDPCRMYPAVNDEFFQ